MKRISKKCYIATAVVAVVIAVAGVGFWVWHETPGFCGAICHTPMDPYLSTYEQEADTQGVDKWGNSVENTDAMLAVSHREAGEDCLSCHIPTMSEQISEGISWASGSYEVFANDTYELVIAERSVDDLAEAHQEEGETLCSNATCHPGNNGSQMSQEELISLTANYEFNPHSNQHGNATCSDCHKAHRASVMYCTQCHQNAEIPDGWISAAEENQLEQVAFGS